VSSSRLGGLLVTCFGLGRMRPGPGTWGSLPAVAVALLLVWLLGADAWTPLRLTTVNMALLLLCLMATFVCLKYGREAEEIFGGKDPQPVVIDEVAGQALALIALPWRSQVEAGAWSWNLLLVATAFLAFRIMDIIKLPPAREMQTLGGGLGIVIDDLIAGIYALVITQAVVRLILM
jgi:phosphatidylglycerophosphatase A